ncbi:hypothetical protein BTO28_16345 [Domibacillus epiphyticus]|uniref:Uncharacterized protein n=2 Tax=Domibacillus epiphyticus TaxID=1714355 RepID=A0A1V2A406_9BACI|nr:hypothetical protein BTO28_16345 [Domibacillus epiphyticus]
MKKILCVTWKLLGICAAAAMILALVFGKEPFFSLQLLLFTLLFGLVPYTVLHHFLNEETQRRFFGLSATIIIALIYYSTPVLGISLFFIPPIFGMLFKKKVYLLYSYITTLLCYLLVTWLHPEIVFDYVEVISYSTLFLIYLTLLYYATVMMTNEEKKNSLFTKTMQALIIAVEAKDAYTEGHSLRVSAYSLSLAERLNQNGYKINIEELRVASILHDIGKINIPSEILQKEDRLTDEEYDIIKSHSVLGYNLAREMEFPQQIWEAILYHHERMDGKGYPHQLKGNEIPLYARIISIADTFDALTTTRAYRSAFSPAKAKDIMIENDGTQFDSKLLRHFIDIIPLLM